MGRSPNYKHVERKLNYRGRKERYPRDFDFGVVAVEAVLHSLRLRVHRKAARHQKGTARFPVPQTVSLKGERDRREGCAMGVIYVGRPRMACDMNWLPKALQP
jgi:hypothetical protein